MSGTRYTSVFLIEFQFTALGGHRLMIGILIGTINMLPLSFVADERPSRESDEKGAGQIKKLMGKELHGNRPGDQPSIPMK